MPVSASELYDESYYRHSFGDIPYARVDAWLTFFGRIADLIVREIGPKSVLDAGCAMGFLVEALRDRGIEAYGVDISRYAIAQVRPDIRPYCWVGSLVDPLPRRYDLVVCIEVLEHLSEEEGRTAVKNLCEAADDVLMASTPSHFTEPTHVNVRPPEYWASLFAEFGFIRDLEFDASSIAPWAMRFSRRQEPFHRLVIPYERRVWLLTDQVASLEAEMKSLRSTVDSLRAEGEDLRREQEALHAQVAERAGELDRVREAWAASARTTQAAEEQLSRVRQRFSYRLLEKVWRGQMRLAPPTSWQGRAWLHLTKLLRKAAHQPLLDDTWFHTAVVAGEEYERWAERCAAVRFDRARARRDIEGFHKRPLVSIIMPVYNTPPDVLRQAIDSVRAQYYPDWELCICDDASPRDEVRAVLEEYLRLDPRVKVTFRERNGGIAVASNSALELAGGEYIALLDHDDEITPDALFEVVSALQNADADLVYSDEDKIDSRGRPLDPFFKPAWSPDLLLSCMYTGHLSVYRKSIVDEIGGFRVGYDGSQDYDLALRFTERASVITHIPKILYHWRMAAASVAGNTHAKLYAYDAAKRALADALSRRGIDGECFTTEYLGFYRIRRRLTDPQMVSVIIPTRDRGDLLRACVSSIEALTCYPSYEIIIADNASTDRDTLDYLAASLHRVLRDDGEYNRSRLMNMAARAAQGEYLLFLNDDTEVLTADWMSEMVEHAQREEVGAVGVKLVHPDGRIRHAGVVLGLGGPAMDALMTVRRHGPGPFTLPNVIRNTSAVSAACLMTRRTLFEEMGGFDEENLPLSYNDVELCLRLRRHGYLIVYTPHAAVRHHGSMVRGPLPGWQEAAHFVATYQAEIADDPYYNPNLTRTGADHSIDAGHIDSIVCIASQPLFTDVTEPIGRESPVGQEFAADRDNLCAIAVKLCTEERTLRGVVGLHVRDSATSTHDLARAEDEASHIRDGEYHTFYFEPIRGSRNRKFYFFLDYSDQSGGSLSVWKSTEPQPALGSLFIHHQRDQGALTFRAFTRAEGGRSVAVRPPQRAILTPLASAHPNAPN